MHLDEIHAQALAREVALGRNLLGWRHDGLGLAELHDHRPLVDPLDEAVEDLVLARLELVVHALPFGLTQLLDDVLLCRLRGDPPERARRHIFEDGVAQLGARADGLRPLEADLAVFDRLLHHGLLNEDAGLTCPRIDARDDVQLGFFEVAPVGGNQGAFKRLEDNFGRNPLLV